MKITTIDIGYYNTYYFANLVDDLLLNRWGYLRALDELFRDEGYLTFIKPFPKYSALHKFTEFIVEMVFDEGMDSEHIKSTMQSGEPQLLINHAYNFYNIEHTTFSGWLSGHETAITQPIEDQLYDYYLNLHLEQPYEDLMKQITDEVFFIMFMNRQVLLNLNNLVSSYISDIIADSDLDEDLRYFERDGVLKRKTIPVWVRRAIYYRDRGACAICRKDISGLVNISNQKNFDHIVPLALGGMNDVTNIQLLCDTCNKKKGKRNRDTSSRYERWYPV
jgi:hypothetical protein